MIMDAKNRPLPGEIFTNKGDGKTYEAVEDHSVICVGCAFNEDNRACYAAPRCAGVIFILKEQP